MKKAVHQYHKMENQGGNRENLIKLIKKVYGNHSLFFENMIYQIKIFSKNLDFRNISTLSGMRRGRARLKVITFLSFESDTPTSNLSYWNTFSHQGSRNSKISVFGKLRSYL